MYRKVTAISLFALALALASCSSQQTATTTSTIAQLCAAAKPLIPTANLVSVASNVGTISPDAEKVASLGKYLTAACNIDGSVAASLVPNVTPDTPVWLTNVITGFAEAAQIAAPLLPALVTLVSG